MSPHALQAPRGPSHRDAPRGAWVFEMERPTAPPEIIDPRCYQRHGYPHAAWEKLRREAPVAWCELDGFLPFWAITRHADVVAISKQPEVFKNAPAMAIVPKDLFDLSNLPTRHLVNMDPPEHRAYRRVASGYFTPRALAACRQTVEKVVDHVLDGLRGRDEIDFVTEVAAAVPLGVIADMLGVPEADWGRFFRWTNEIVGCLDPEFQRDGVEKVVLAAIGDQFAYFQEMVEERRRRPREDLTSALANASLGDGPLPMFELLSYLMLLITAGNETTRNAASGGLLAFSERPDQLARLRDEPELVPCAAEEVLRFTTPAVHMVRTAAEDVEVRGQTVRAGEHLALFYPSANRDEDVFEEPFEFRIDRQPNWHLTFGVGEHVCLGAHLARIELQSLLAGLARRIEHVELRGPVQWLRASFVGGIKHMPVRLTLRPQ